MPPRFADLLLQILHCDPARPDRDAIAVLSNDDWELLTIEAIRYRLAYQVRSWIKAEPWRLALVPPASLARLDAAVRATVMRNLAQQGYLRNVLTACAAADLPVILLKGLWLGETVYRNVGARSTGDIDLLLQKKDMPRFTRLARELGFEVPGGVFGVRKSGFDVPEEVASLCDLAPTSNEFPLAHPASKAALDIHWALTRQPEEKAIDEAKLWARSEVAKIAGCPGRGLCPEDHLLLLCFHAANHHRFLYVGPRALVDVAHTITQPPRPLDWDDLIARAKEMGWERGTWLMFDLVREHLGVQPPRRVFDALRPADDDLAQVREAALEAIFLDQQHQTSLGRNVVRVWDEKSWRKRASILLTLVFPAKEAIAAQFATPVGTAGFEWLYVKRWYLLFKNHFASFVALAKRDAKRSAEFERTRLIAAWIER